MGLVRTVVDRDSEAAEPALSGELKELYDGDLRFDAAIEARPYVVANFVSTLDGVVSYKLEGNADGSTISGSNAADKFIMGLLRASVDAILIGAGTLRDVSAESLWTPESTFPDAKRLYTEYRVNTLHRPENPLLVIVSGSGRLELERKVFRTQGMRTLIITTSTGANDLKRAGAATLEAVEVQALHSSGGHIAPQAILQLLHSQFGVMRLLHEGGPTLFGQFLAADAVDELFLTLSPQIAGRNGNASRPSIGQGVDFTPNSAPWFQTVSVKEQAQYLYLRYRRA